MTGSAKTYKLYLDQVLIFFAVNFMYLLSHHALGDGKLWYQHTVNRDFSALFWFADQSKISALVYLYGYLGIISNPLLYSRVISFICLLFTGLIFRWFMELYKIGSAQGRFWAGVFFCLMPSYLVGAEFCHIAYNLGVFALFLAIWLHQLTLIFMRKNQGISFFINLLACLVAYWAFSLNKALLFMYAVGLLQSIYYFYKVEGFNEPWESLKTWSIRYFHLILVVPFFWLNKEKPFGIYDNYNQVDFGNFKLILELVKVGFYEGGLKAPLRVFMWSLKDGVLFVLGLIFASVYFYKSRSYGVSFDSKVKTRTGIILAMVFWLMVIFPYAVVGKAAAYMDYSSRHGLLFAYPQSLLVLFFTSWLLLRAKKYIYVRIGLALIFGLLSSSIFENFHRWDIDWFKREAMVARFRESDEIRQASKIVLDDETTSLDHLNRGVEFYEHSGFAVDAFGDQRRLVYDKRFIPLDKYVSDPIISKYYLSRDFDPKGKSIMVTLKKGALDLNSWSNYLSLKRDYHFNRKKFLSRIGQALELQIQN